MKMSIAILSFLFWLLYISIASFPLCFCLPFVLGGFYDVFLFPLFLFHVFALDLCFVITMRFEKMSHR